jgi:hypothetical protein
MWEPADLFVRVRPTHPTLMPPRSDFCLASSPAQAERILRDLHQAGFAPTEISLLFLEPAEPADDTIAASWSDRENVRPIAIVGIDPLLAAGPIAKTMGRSNVRSMAAGLIAFGIPDTEADRYETLIRRQHILIAVHTANSDRGNGAREIFKAAAAVDIFTIMAVTTPRVPILRSQNWSRATAG